MPNHRIYIDGAAGTTGLEIHGRMAAAPDIDLVVLPDEARKQLSHRLAAMAEADLTILCLPDEASREIVAAAPAGVRICDASTAHRTAEGWVYGFAEIGGRRRLIQNAAKVSVPGCHATGFLALVAPLVETGVLPPTAVVGCQSITGYSGGGKKMIAEYEAEDRPPAYNAPRLYALSLNHKHLPEMTAVSGLRHPPLFCPVVADFYSGLLVSIALEEEKLPADFRSPGRIAGLYQDYYAQEPLISVKALAAAPADGTLAAAAMAGRDDLEIFVLGNEKQLLLAARLDNLGKGAAGAAVQCANLMLGRPETAGLRIGI